MTLFCQYFSCTPSQRGVAALISVSDDKIQITKLILRRGALSTHSSNLRSSCSELLREGLPYIFHLYYTFLCSLDEDIPLSWVAGKIKRLDNVGERQEWNRRHHLTGCLDCSDCLGNKIIKIIFPGVAAFKKSDLGNRMNVGQVSSIFIFLVWPPSSLCRWWLGLFNLVLDDNTISNKTKQNKCKKQKTLKKIRNSEIWNYKMQIWLILRCWGKSSILCQQNSDAL